MRLRARVLLALLPFVFAAAGPLAGQASPVTVFIVRHAEKGPEPGDPGLTPAGEARAGALVRVLEDAEITALFATEFRRTRETVAPLGRKVGLETTIVPAREVDRLVEQLAAPPAGSRAVVASHSNLVHLIAGKLAGTGVPELTEADYDRLYVVTVLERGRGSVVVLRYGDPSPAGAAGSMKP